MIFPLYKIAFSARAETSIYIESKGLIPRAHFNDFFLSVFIRFHCSCLVFVDVVYFFSVDPFLTCFFSE